MPYKTPITEEPIYDLPLAVALRVARAMAKQSSCTIYVSTNDHDARTADQLCAIYPIDFPAGSPLIAIYTLYGAVENVSNPLPLPVAIELAEKGKGATRTIFHWKGEPGLWRSAVFAGSLARQITPKITAHYRPGEVK